MLSSGRRLSTSSMQQGGPDEEEGLVLAAQRAQQRALENEYDAAQFVQGLHAAPLKLTKESQTLCCACPSAP
eukprot:scaffold21338_cov13-Tisochrysis_lutea.AAC.1